ncbi:MAG: amidohydrolase family protein [Firmicutes bacterium]|nr:amidohydrolase family protein [Bacillota bacterium]
MGIPRIAISQAPYVRDTAATMERVLAHMTYAASRGAELIVFPEWFLGMNPIYTLPNRLTDQIGRHAQNLGLSVITGSMRTVDDSGRKKQQQAVFIDASGRLRGRQAKLTFYPSERPWFEPGETITPINAAFGRIIVLIGPDARDSALWEEVSRLSPHLLIMAASPHNAEDRQQIQDVALMRSKELANTVAVTSMLGTFGGTTYVGGACVCQNGQLIGSLKDEDTVLLGMDEAAAPLIQLGVTDVASYLSVVNHPFGPEPSRTPSHPRAPEAEKQVLLDWAALVDADPLTCGYRLKAAAKSNPRSRALAPLTPYPSAGLAALINDEAVVGAYAYPGLHRLSPDDSVWLEAGRLLAAVHKPLVVHTGPGPAPLKWDHPELWDEFLSTYPTIPLLLIQSGGDKPYSDQALRLAQRHPHVWLETSRLPAPALIEALETLGADRLVFGTGGLPDQLPVEKEKMTRLESRIAPITLQKILSRNAQHLFFTAAAPAEDPTVPLRAELSVVRPHR